MKFQSSWNQGFHMTFENGLSASVQWGFGTYTDNHYKSGFEDTTTSTTAEVAVANEDGELIDLVPFLPEDCRANDVVCGHLSPDEVVEFLIRVKNYEM